MTPLTREIHDALINWHRAWDALGESRSKEQQALWDGILTEAEEQLFILTDQLLEQERAARSSHSGDGRVESGAVRQPRRIGHS